LRRNGGTLLSLSYANANRYEYDRMRIEADQYRVRPRKKRDGWNLESERLSHGTLWYTNEADAISYAKWLSRVKGCKIEILDQAGNILRTEESPSGNFAY
jgi:hypothetical protein